MSENEESSIIQQFADGWALETRKKRVVDFDKCQDRKIRKTNKLSPQSPLLLTTS